MIDAREQVEQTLTEVLKRARNGNCPPRLAAAMNHAVFPGGARIRPQLCLAVAGACGSENPRVALPAAAAIELLHCASLVHDDLPCFDNAPLRRGKPSLHAAYGERLALLAGDALIVLAFEALADSIAVAPARAAELFKVVSRGAGVPAGIAAGQAWECEPRAGLRAYQRTKTGALFVAATLSGATAAGCAAEPWREMGERLGEACQVATEARHDASSAGKLKHLVGLAVDAIPACPKAAELRLLILLEARQYIPAMLSQRVA